MGDIYKAYLDNIENEVENENTKTMLFDFGGTSYRVIMTKKRANRLSLIRCMNKTVVWEQIPLLYLRYNERGRGDVIDTITVDVDKKYVTLFVIKGKPREFWGLDEGAFCSANHFDASRINLMSEKRFKKL